MSAISDLIGGIVTRLTGAAGLAGVSILVEDPEDLETQIKESLGKVGALILIGQPKWRNAKRDSQAAENDVTIEIAIGEAPTIWRGNYDLPIAPTDAAYDGDGRVFYTGLVNGNQYNWVPDEDGTILVNGTPDDRGGSISGSGVFEATGPLAFVDLGTPLDDYTGSLVLPGGGGVKPVCSDLAQTVTRRLQGFKAASGFRYLSVQSGDPVPDKKRQIYQVVLGTKWIVGPAA